MIRTSGNIPAGVLAEELAEAIDGRRVVAAVFTTFCFDPAFFELHILPLLFDRSFHQVDKVKLLQLDDALRDLEDLAVYYDRSALSQDALPARLDVRRIDVARPGKGVFHPKVVLVLVENPADDDHDPDGAGSTESLIVGLLSANLTRAGWWENVECGHFEEIADRSVDPKRCSFRKDLLSLLRAIKSEGRPGDDHRALDRIHRFARDRLAKKTMQKAKAQGTYYTRIFCGQGSTDVASWLAELRLHRHELNLEVISPYFDAHGLGVLERLIDAVGPRETRVYLPRDPAGGEAGAAEVTEATYRAMDDIDGARWATLEGPIAGRSRGSEARRLPRRVHAKVYRLWKKSGPDLWLLGSVNLTGAGHSHLGAGNLEAAYFFDASAAGGPRRWWLQPDDEEVAAFQDTSPGENEGLDEVPIHISVRYDWATGALSVRAETAVAAGVELCDPTGGHLATVDRLEADRWVSLPSAVAERVRAALASTSFLELRRGDDRWRVLVREENMGHRPSLLRHLSPEEILEYWALLSAEQRAAFIELHLGRDTDLEGIPVVRRDARRTHDSMFDRFAGIFHAFGCLRRHAVEALDEGRLRDAESRILGARYDSLPALLEKTVDTDGGDPVARYVTVLCARELRARLGRDHPELFELHPERAAALDELLARAASLREALAVDGDAAAFFEWYESAFLDVRARGAGPR